MAIKTNMTMTIPTTAINMGAEFIAGATGRQGGTRCAYLCTLTPRFEAGQQKGALLSLAKEGLTATLPSSSGAAYL